MNKALKIIISILLLVIFTIIVPLIINKLYKISAPHEFLASEWNASDALNFYGTILSAFVATLGIYISLKDSSKKSHEDRVLASLPYFAIENIDVKTKTNRFFDLLNPSKDITPNKFEDYYSEEKPSHYYFVIDENNVIIKNSFTDEQIDMIQNGGIYNFTDSNGNTITAQHDYSYAVLTTKNIGNGCAINCIIGINEISIKKNERKYTLPNPRYVNESATLHILFLYDGHTHHNIEYELELMYKDIYGNNYSQQRDILIKDNKIYIGTNDKQLK